ncbi:uncharacterized protein BP01DRAFT_389168 [Aspergillus saccharolyticus JOP 1030-1]|uniref:Uncharacterized protein n=1 Tax=Aspergillus saccharolyticus JOP 1030-1 TaxID=1450539 RepID=A0A318ZW32_9EURO|nr:hypothetical protein BP01DRAFT_389168 [Aspergillus saccharolyticus JOP 1030-1]PYH48563.1 hypothetical protein BP01DRAFT_389168 [Aspergillus saccharolyticus JOP 1030-1]
MEKIIAQYAVWERGEDEQGPTMQRRTSPPRHKLQAKKPSARRFSVIGLSRDTLQSETMELTFGCLALHRNCWGILRALRDACDPHLRQIHDWRLRVRAGAIVAKCLAEHVYLPALLVLAHAHTSEWGQPDLRWVRCGSTY